MFLESLHVYSKKWFFKVLLGLISLSFLGFGITDLVYRFIHNRPVATVGNTHISKDDLMRAVSNELSRRQQSRQSKFSPEDIKKFDLVNNILQRSIIESAREQLNTTLDLRISDFMIKDAIRSLPLTNAQGIYDPSILKAILKQQNISEAQFYHQIRTSLMHQHMNSALVPFLKLPQVYQNILTDTLTLKAIFHVALIAIDSVPLAKPISDEDLTLFFNTHQENFRVPEYREVSYIVFDMEKDKTKIVISDDEVNQRYEQNSAEYTTPEMRDVIKLSFDSFARAQEAETILAKEKLSVALKKLSNARRDSLGKIDRGSVPQSFADAIFKTAAEKPTPILENGATYVIYISEKIYPSRARPLSEVKAAIINELQTEKYVDQSQALRNSLEDALAGGESLVAVAKKMQLTCITPEAFNQKGRTRLDKPALDAYDLPKEVTQAMISQAFTADSQETPVIELSATHTIALNVKTIHPSHIPEFSSVASKVRATREREMKRKQLRSRLAAIARRVTTPELLSQQLKKENVSFRPETIEACQLDGETQSSISSAKAKGLEVLKSFSASLRKQLFNMPLQSATQIDVDNNTMMIVFRSANGTRSLPTDNVQKLREQLNILSQRDVEALVGQAAQATIKTKIDDDELATVARAFETTEAS